MVVLKEVYEVLNACMIDGDVSFLGHVGLKEWKHHVFIRSKI